MKKILLLLVSCAISVQVCMAQSPEKYNLGFENKKEKSQLSEGWFQWGTHDLTIENQGYLGTKSGKITSNASGNFGSIAYKIPANYAGKVIKLEGFMKIKNVEEGFAGLLLRIDENGASAAFDNMQNQNITGTKDWQKYSITLDYPKNAEAIFVGGILVGQGEAWFDDFTLSLDGKNIQSLSPAEKPTPKAKLDKEFAQGSKIQISSLSVVQISNLELLGQVWGYLKYYHPEIAKGNYNWDYELFRFLPKYLDSKNNRERDQLLLSWIDSLGPINICTTCKPTAADAKLKPDFTWVNNQENALKAQLLHVYNNRAQGKQYYVGIIPDIGNPEFRNESPYLEMSYPDSGFRLLALYRYWNMINYFFPYKNLMDKDWSKTLKEYIPKFIDANDELEYEVAAIQLIGDIQDTHANLWGGADKIDEWKGINYPPFHVRFIENKLVITDYYNEALMNASGLKIGDVISKINGRSIENIVSENSKYYPASNIPTRLRDISAAILRSNSKELAIEYASTGSGIQSKKLQLYPKDSLDIFRWYRTPTEKCYKMLSDNIGYVTLANIQEVDIEKIKTEFKDTKGIIIDIRNYPSTFVVFSLGSYFVATSTPFVKFSVNNLDNPGEFNFTPELEIPAQGNTYQGKLVVLINELSQSQAEYTAMAFKAGINTTLIGSTTAGADGNVSTILLPGGLRTMISGIGVNYPNGGETQKIGIVPDLEVKPSIEGIRNGKDELLEKAIEIILKN